MAPRRARRASSRRRAAHATPAPVPVPRPTPVPFVRLTEAPHAHIVCRHCGRISTVELESAERELLVALASRHPDDWSVDGIAFSLTGACPRCRQGPRA